MDETIFISIKHEEAEFQNLKRFKETISHYDENKLTEAQSLLLLDNKNLQYCVCEVRRAPPYILRLLEVCLLRVARTTDRIKNLTCV